MSGPLLRPLLTVLAASTLLALPAAATAATSQSFTTPGPASFTVPSGVTEIKVDAIGGQGGTGLQTPPYCRGGAGSRVQATMAVTPGQQLWVVVGGAGGSIVDGTPSTDGGYNGGGNGGRIQWSGGGGGGASDIRTLPATSGLTPVDSRLLVAGGGGGAGGGYQHPCPAGGSGGAVPGAGQPGAFDSTPGEAGTQTTGGVRGLSASCGSSAINGLIVPSTVGALGVGGNGAYDTNQGNSLCVGSGGGGGGGRYGGGGGGASQIYLWVGGGGGGAGSNYTASGISNVTITGAPWAQQSAALPGSVTLDWTPAAPTATIATPAGGGTYTVGQTVATSFSCADGANGGGITSCVDGANRTSPSVLDTSTPGTHTYTVTATSASGRTGTATIDYTVAAAPTVSIAAPGNDQTYAVGQVVPTAFTCAEGVGGPGIASCEDGAGADSPGVLNTSTPGTHTYAVTATSQSGQIGSASITYTVAAAPTATITGPATNQTYAVDQVVPTSFTCAEGASGPGIATCRDGAGVSSPGVLDTSTPGTHSYTVTARSESGQTGTRSISYTVAAAPTATIATPANNRVFAVDEVVPVTFSCAEGASGPGLASCRAGDGATSPDVLDTGETGTFSYTVTATSESGQTGTATISYTVAAAPTATITDPEGGLIYAADEVVPARFTCEDGASGPGIESCQDGDGRASPTTLDTTGIGTFSYTVTATSESGQTGTATISYTVAAAPTATISGPEDGQVYAVDEVVPTTFTCEDGASGPGIASCEDGSGTSSPSTLDTSQTGTYDYTVTATSASGQTHTASISYTVAAAPTATISGPEDGQVFAVDEVVPTTFVCEDGASGPGIETCEDGTGSTSPGVLDTSQTGTFDYTVTATSASGQTGTASIGYTVVAPPAPPPEAPGGGTPPGGSSGSGGTSGPGGTSGSSGASGSGGTGSGSGGPTTPVAPLRLTQVATNRTCVGNVPRSGRDVTVRYRLARPATVRFVLERRVSPGPIRVSRCPGASTAERDRGTPAVYRAATVVQSNDRRARALRTSRKLRAGRHQIALLRTLKAQDLAPGRYRVRMTPRSAGEDGRTTIVYFWVIG